MYTLTYIAEFSGVSRYADAFPVDAVAVVAAVRHRALVLPQLALPALVAGVALALPPGVQTLARAQHGAVHWWGNEEFFFFEGLYF